MEPSQKLSTYSVIEETSKHAKKIEITPCILSDHHGLHSNSCPPFLSIRMRWVKGHLVDDWELTSVEEQRSNPPKFNWRGKVLSNLVEEFSFQSLQMSFWGEEGLGFYINTSGHQPLCNQACSSGDPETECMIFSLQCFVSHPFCWCPCLSWTGPHISEFYVVPIGGDLLSRGLFSPRSARLSQW